MTVQPGSARWQELVRIGIIKDGDRNWFLGDAALEIAPMGGEVYHNGSEANLRRYADEIGVEYHSIVEYRRVSAAWSSNNRVLDTPWKVHAQLAARKDLIRPGMTVSQAALALGHRNVGRTGPEAPVEHRVAAARDYLADPEVARQVMADPDTVQGIVGAAPAPVIRAAIEQHHDQVRQRVEQGPSAHSRNTTQARIEVQRVLQRLAELRVSAGKLAEMMGTVSLTAGEVEELTEEARETLAVVQWLAGLDKASTGNIDEELADLFRREGDS